MKTESIISVAKYDDSVTIMVEDKNSSMIFHEITMTRDEFFRAFINSGHASCQSKTANLDKIGLEMEYEKFEFKVPDHNFFDRKEITILEVTKALYDAGKSKQGWIPDIEFSSQDSFFMEGSQQMARTTIRRWVKPQPELKL